MHSRRFLTALLGAAVGLLPLTDGARSAPVLVNPALHPVVVTGETPELQSVQLVVRDARDRLVASSLGREAVGLVTVRWSGGGGRDARGALVRDGRYRLALVATVTGQVLGPVVTVTVDRTAPRVALAVPSAMSRGSRSPLVRVMTRDAGSRQGVRVRLRVTETSGRAIVSGRWRAPRGRLELPGRALAGGRAGVIMVSADARDTAGNQASSTPVPVVVTPGPGPARLVSRVITRRRAVALTVDDGYSSAALASMLTTLEREDATVTFCLTGAAVAGYTPALVARLRRAARAGRALPCDHGWSHGTGAGTSEGAARGDLGHMAVARAFRLAAAPFYRPPYGAFGPGIMRAAGALGYREVLLWDIDTNDWRGRTPAAITAQVVKEARPGSIALLHTLPQSAAALPDVIRGLRARGLEPVGIGELIASGRPVGGPW